MQGSQFFPTKIFLHPRLRLLALFMLLALLILGSSGQVLAKGNNAGAVYVMNNDEAENAILVFDQAGDGTLTEAGSFATGGQGTGSGLGSQGAIALTQSRRWLLAVNAGSNELSVFLARGNRLSLRDKVSSGGEMPISVTVRGRLVYVLNAGDPGSITGFYIGLGGRLRPIPNSTRYLSNAGAGAAPGPAQIAFTPNGQHLVVTEKGTNQILTYRVLRLGHLADPIVHASEGTTPFGFDFTHRGDLLVSEAFGGAAGASTASSYAIKNGQLQVISSSVPTHQTAACWLVVSKNGKYAYTTNTGSSSVSGFEISPDGSITLLDADGVTGETAAGSRPIDAIFSKNGRYLYVLSGNSNTVDAFQLAADGGLTNLGYVAVPDGSVGIMAR
jgi:6-phosphogluconolactonase